MSALNKIFSSLFGSHDERSSEVPEPVQVDPMDPPFEVFSDYLNYAAYDEVNQLFLLDGVGAKPANPTPLGCGFVLELNPLIGANDETISRLASMFATIPKDVNWSISLLGSPNIDQFLTRYEKIQGARTGANGSLSSDLFNRLSKKRSEFWRRGTHSSLFQGNPMRFRDYRLIMSVNFTRVKLENVMDVERMLATREAIVSSLRASNMFGKVWDADDLLAWVRTLLNPQMMFRQAPPKHIEYDSLNAIRSQIMSSETPIHVLNSGTEIRFGAGEDQVSMRALSVSGYPGSNYFHLAQMLNMIGDATQINLNYPCPFLINLAIKKGDYESVKNVTTMRAARAAQNAGSPLAKVLPDLIKKNADWQMALESFESGAGGLVELMHQVIIWDRPESIVAAENAARSIWQTNGFSLAADQYLQMQSLRAMLPMALDKDLTKNLTNKRRFVRKTMVNSACLSPVLGEWSGIGEPVVGLFGRCGQAMGIDLFANSAGNYNAAVIGTSGSGKSFFINEIVRNYIASGARCWVIDVGRSYQKLCEFLGGQAIEFDPDSQIVINPFDMIMDINDEIEMLKMMFGLMISPNDGLTDYQYSYLEEAILHVYGSYGNSAQIDHLIDQLINTKGPSGDTNIEVQRMGEQLRVYGSNGANGKWFNGASNLKFDSDFIVLELEELKSKPALQQVIMRFVMYQITQEMYLTRDKEKLVVIDEAWDILSGGSAAGKFTEEGYRRARKYRGAFLTGTQGARDYERSDAAMAALQNSDWLFLLRGKEDTIMALESKINMTEHMKRTIRSLNTQSGQYSDVFCYCGGQYGVGRLVSDPFNALLSSSRGEDFQAVKDHQARGLNIEQAIEAVLIERGISF